MCILGAVVLINKRKEHNDMIDKRHFFDQPVKGDKRT